MNLHQLLLRFIRWYLNRYHRMATVDRGTLGRMVNVAEWANIISKDEPGRSREASVKALCEASKHLRFTERNSLIIPGTVLDWFRLRTAR